MKGQKVLDAAHYPQITFTSNSVRKVKDGATIDGNITIRGVTRPISFAAQFYRQKGTDAGDLSQLTILLSGTLKRSEFGASGWSAEAGDLLTLRILGRIHQT